MALENKLGLTSSADLAREEERISKKKAVALFEKGLLNQLEAGTFSSLQFIHKYLFEDIYDFAGELRTVNIAKGNFRFAPVMYLEAALSNIHPNQTYKNLGNHASSFRLMFVPQTDTYFDTLSVRKEKAGKCDYDFTANSIFYCCS